MTTDSRHRRLLANRYQLIDLLGSGAMGQVYRAEDKLLGGVTVAVKFLSQALLNKRMKERFEREATISALLGEKSSHIIRVRDYGVDEKEIPFYVMEYLQGDSLSEIVKFRPLNVPRFLNITRQICFGMECAHKGISYQGELCPIVHRDIKPSNMLVVQDAALGELVKILDFGIAKLIQAEGSQTQSFMGTLAYCSPEQMEGKELDSRSDIYSLGVMMYEILSGEMPIFPENSSFGGWYEAHHYAKPHPFHENLRIPPTLEKLIGACLAKSPGDRPQSVGEILKSLESIETLVSVDNRQHNLDSAPTVIANPSIPKPSLTGAKEACLNATWPEDKPLQKIVFPYVMRASESNFASLWVMLEQEDILNRIRSTRYNQFLFMTSPHPMVLWITVLYHPLHGPRWLPCYLDLKTTAGQKFVRLLGEIGTYWLVFFALENSAKAQHPFSISIAPNQCQLLKEWADSSQVLKGDKPQITKRLLRKEFERLKPSILSKLEGTMAKDKTQRSPTSLKI